MKRKVSVIGTVGLPAAYGGFETLAENLSVRHESKWADEIDFAVYCSKHSYEKKLASYRKTKLRYINCKANGLFSVMYDMLSMIDSIKRKDDVAIVLGVSGCLFLPIFRLISKTKIVVNIDGMEWKREKWGWFAKRFLRLSERIAVKYSDVVICDNQAIVDYVKSCYLIDSVNIAYGGDHVNVEIPTEIPCALPSDYYFSVCRIEPENNIGLILDGFMMVPHANFVMVGNWDASEYGRALRVKYSSIRNIFLSDPIYDIKVLQAIRSGAKVYVHGHSAGGTNPSLVEAMSTGLPVFAYDCNFNRNTTHDGCFYFSNSADLCKLIESIKEELDDCKKRMRDIANTHYRWDQIADRYFSLCY